MSNVNIDSINLVDDVIYTIMKIHPDMTAEDIKPFLDSLAKIVSRFLQSVVSGNKPFWLVRGAIRWIRVLCKRYSMAETLILHDTIEEIAPKLLESFSKQEYSYHQISTFREIHKNNAMVFITIRELANLFGISGIKIPSNRLSKEDRSFLTQIVYKTLSDMTLEQKANILIAFWFNYGKKIGNPARDALLQIDKSVSIAVIKQALHRDFHGYRLKMILDLLKQIDPSAMESVTERVEEIKIQLNEPVRKLAQEKSIDELIEALGSNSYEMRQNSALALAHKCNSDDDVDKVIDVLNHKNYKARIHSVIALGAMPKNACARAAILGAINNSYLRVRREALRVYVRFNPADATDVLIRVLKRQDSWHVKLAVIVELRKYLNDERVLNTLKEIQSNEREHQKVRSRAEKLLLRAEKSL